MKIIDKIKDRHNILIIIFALILISILLRVFYLTIVMGESLRELADNSRQRTIRIDAPRGKIYDRYGRVLATNKTTFKVQLIKDDLQEENFNDLAIKIMNILEEDGETLYDNVEFPILLNSFIFKNIDNGLNNSVSDEVVRLIIDNNLIYKLLDKVYVSNDYKFNSAYISKQILERKGIKIPINIDFKDSEVDIYFLKSENVLEWKKENNIPSYYNAKESLGFMITKDNKNISRLLKYPVFRGQVYNLLVEKGLDSNISLVKYQYEMDNKILKIKSSFSNVEKITNKSSAKEDFINIILNYEMEDSKGEQTTVIEEFLSKVYENKKEGYRIIFADILINKLKEIGVDVPIRVESKDDKVEFLEKENYDLFLKKEEVGEKSALKVLIELIKKYKIYDDELKESKSLIEHLITSDDYKYDVQRHLIEIGINPRISVSKWQFTKDLEKRYWLSRVFKSEEALNYSANVAFNKLVDKYEIDSKYSDYEKLFILILKEKLLRHNGKDYEPIDLAKDVSYITVSKVLENQNNLIGISIASVPTRYYPMNETASHILGYLGKISSENEIKKYLKNRTDNKYSPNDMVGESGIEHKFEEHLKGMYGYKRLEVDVYGRTKKIIEEKKPIPGNNIYLTIDAKLQKVAEDSLKHAIEQIRIGGEFKSKWGNYSYKTRDGKVYKNASTGSIVALDVKTGEVLALANYPQFNPNLFTSGISNEDWDSLNPKTRDPLAPKPLYNLALQSAIQPGSTFKMITGLAALEKGISPNFIINSKGYIDYGGQRFQDWQWNRGKGYAYGPTNLYTAIRDSVNYYFYTISLGKNLRTGEYVYNKDGEKTNITLNDITRLAKEFGLDDKTGIEIEIPGEKIGNVPKIETKINNIKNNLRNYLKKYIHDILINDNLNDTEINNIIDEVVKLVDMRNELSNSGIINRLKSLGLDTTKLANDHFNKKETYSSRILFSFIRQAKWDEGDTLNVSIGQGENAYTPLQMANYIATLANDGYRNKVSVIDTLKTFDGKNIEFNTKEEPILIDIKNYKNELETPKQKKDRIKSYLVELKKGMLLVSTEGTAKKAFRDFPVLVGSKTGTAEREGINPETGESYDSFGWFVAFAPYEDPQIAVAGVIFQAGSGGSVSPVAREIIAEYLGLNKNYDRIEFRNKLVK